jgi:hypothetical protein
MPKAWILLFVTDSVDRINWGNLVGVPIQKDV